jgi:hypothetical protein
MTRALTGMPVVRWRSGGDADARRMTAGVRCVRRISLPLAAASASISRIAARDTYTWNEPAVPGALAMVATSVPAGRSHQLVARNRQVFRHGEFL